MSNRPELISTARDVQEVRDLAEAGADALIIGHQTYGLRLPGDFELNDIEQAAIYLHSIGKKTYVSTNAIFHNENLSTLPDYITKLTELNVDGVICGDPSVFPILNESVHHPSILWNPETLSTNYETLKFWESKGIERAVLSNELSIEAICEIKQKISVPVEIQIHGMTCIFQSKRKLVSNYYHYIDKELAKEKIYLSQSNEQDTHYPIFEDCNGTHIMSNEDICMIEQLTPILNGNIDCLRINGLMKSRDYNKKIVSIYREAIDFHQHNKVTDFQKHQWKQKIVEIQPEERKLTTGFYFKAQIY